MAKHRKHRKHKKLSKAARRKIALRNLKKAHAARRRKHRAKKSRKHGGHRRGRKSRKSRKHRGHRRGHRKHHGRRRRVLASRVARHMALAYKGGGYGSTRTRAAMGGPSVEAHRAAYREELRRRLAARHMPLP